MGLSARQNEQGSALMKSLITAPLSGDSDVVGGRKILRIEQRS